MFEKHFQEYINRAILAKLECPHFGDFEIDYDIYENNPREYNGTITAKIDCRPYNEGRDYDMDEEEDPEEDYFDESENWDLETGLKIKVENGIIKDIEITAQTFCSYMDSLGDIDPDEYWQDKDDDYAIELLNKLCRPTPIDEISTFTLSCCCNTNNAEPVEWEKEYEFSKDEIERIIAAHKKGAVLFSDDAELSDVYERIYAEIIKDEIRSNTFYSYRQTRIIEYLKSMNSRIRKDHKPTDKEIRDYVENACKYTISLPREIIGWD